MSSTRSEISHLIKNIKPLDEVEKTHISETLSWINSGSEIFRIKKPDTPNKHLVSYCCLIDKSEHKILLVEHKKALLWLPPGGHVDINEHPLETAKRECQEELRLTAKPLYLEPIFLTVTKTVGNIKPHTDVSLWFLLEGDSTKDLDFCKEEFFSVKWFPIDKIPLEKSDPNMRRFIAKLKSKIKTIL